MVLASAVAVVHAAAVALVLTGALVGLRSRRVLLVHGPVAAAVAAVHLAGADCPLTTWERDLREGSGAAYDGGFLDHYAFEPLGLDSATPQVQAGVYAVVLLPNLVGYGLLVLRRWRRGSVDRVTSRDRGRTTTTRSGRRRRRCPPRRARAGGTCRP